MVVLQILFFLPRAGFIKSNLFVVHLLVSVGYIGLPYITPYWRIFYDLPGTPRVALQYRTGT